MWELVISLRLLRDPSRAGLHLPWIESVRPVLPELDLAAALSLLPPEGYIPDFLSPPPSTPLAKFEDELEVVRATPAKQVRFDVGLLLGRRAPTPLQRPFLDHPRRTVNRLAHAFAAYWERTLEPHWPRVHALLQADVHHRARRLTEGGPAALFADLHPGVQWSEGRLSVEVAYDKEIPLEGRGLLLMPSAFQWDRPGVITQRPWQPTLFYPARGVATLWEPGSGEGPQALAGVVGRGRAAVLAALDAPRSTSELARRLGLTAGAVSQHVGSLRAAGLVTSEREGRGVLHARTGLADGLVAGPQMD
jgi:DNA-binding transcriptional ArsR family regulator